MSVVWHGVSEFGDACVHLDLRVKEAGKAASAIASRELAAAAAAEAPKVSGTLAGSMVSKSITISGTPVVKVGPTAIYSRRVELGFRGKTRSGKQRRKGVLSTEIFGPSGKGVRVGYSTRGLQPTKPNPYLERALVASRERIGKIYRAAWAKALTK